MNNSNQKQLKNIQADKGYPGEDDKECSTNRQPERERIDGLAKQNILNANLAKIGSLTRRQVG